MKEYIAVDSETTGFDPIHCSLIQAAAVKFNERGGIISTYSKKFKPNIAYGPGDGAFKVHKIPYESLIDKPFYKSSANREIKSICKGQEIVGHNLGFDLGFLDFKYLDLKAKHDTLKLARQAWPKKRNNLMSACERAGIPKPPKNRFHDAVNDAIQAAYLFLYLTTAYGRQLELDFYKEVKAKVYVTEKVYVKTRVIKNKFNDKPFMDSGGLVVPFGCPIENHWWKKEAKKYVLIGQETVKELNDDGNEVDVIKDVFDVKPLHPDVKFKKFEEILSEA